MAASNCRRMINLQKSILVFIIFEAGMDTQNPDGIAFVSLAGS
jgi:hypothetical protein